jgi:F420-dependent oxidoreductase-like protein
MGERRLSRRGFVKGMAGMAVAGALAAPIERARATPPPAGRVRFGVQARPEHVAYEDLLRVWQEADELGYDIAYTFDHMMPIDGRDGPCFEGWTLLSALAAQTRRIRVGVLVTGNTYRWPALLAKMAATVDHVSHGRLVLGMGAGWFEAEHVAYGIPFGTPGGRARRLVEAVTVVKSLFTEERSTVAGKHYPLKDAPFLPKTVQRPHPPILIGGMGPKVVRPLAARHADIWHFMARDPEEAKKTIADFDALCEKVGRDPASVEMATNLRTEDVAGRPAKEVRAHVEALAEAGVGQVVLSLSAPYDRALLRTVAKDVIPAFRGRAARRSA